MESRRLHNSLHEFAADAGAALTAAVAAGDEIPFEVVAEGAKGSRPGLYCYQPLTSEFIDRHWDRVRALPAAHAALAALVTLAGLQDYLDAYAAEQRTGVPLATEALRCFAHRAFDGAGDFELLPERFEPAYRELREAAGGQSSELAVAALLRGIACESAEVVLAEGTVLIGREALETLPPDAAWREHEGLGTVVVIVPGAGPDALEGVLERLRDVQTALRLYSTGIALAPLAWIRGLRDPQERAATGWRALPIPGGGSGDGAVVITASHEEELAAFVSLIARRRPVDGELAWALERFELGCERGDGLIGLSDHLLALRALLEPEGPRSGRLAGRLAALCALPEHRRAVTERIARAISLEHSLIAGVAVGGDAIALAEEIEQHLRAVLRDVICGHLSAGLVELADALLAEQIEPEPTGELRVLRTPRDPEPEVEGPFDDYCATEGEASLLSERP